MIPGLKIFDRYLTREFVITLCGVVGACAVVLLIAKVFEEFDTIAESPATLKDAVGYFLVILPYRLVEILPLATMLAVIFSVGNLARNREMLAMTASGQSPYRSAAPILFSTLLMSFGIIGLNETLIPWCQERVAYYEDGIFKGRGETIRARRYNILEKGMGNMFYSMATYDGLHARMENVMLWEESDDSMLWQWSLQARSAELVEKDTSPGRDRWRFAQAIEEEYDGSGQPVKMTFHPEMEMEMEANLDQYLANRKEPEQMNLVELSRYMAMLKQRDQDISQYRTDWYLKLAFPFSTFILGMIAFALALRAHTASLPLAFGIGVFLTMVFYALAALGQTLGHVAALPPIVGALTPMALFLGLAVHLLRRSGFAM